jgi:superfamily II DNA/RNA helicase
VALFTTELLSKLRDLPTISAKYHDKTRICSNNRMNESKRKSSKKDGESRRSQQDVKDTPQNPNKPGSDDVVSDVDNGTRLRRMLGLVATVESESSTTHLPDPYAESCLEENCESDDSLIKLAKHTFKKLSSKMGTKNWSPTPIQLQSWPILKSSSSKSASSDTKHTTLIAIATTGSGKTLGYAVPMIDSCAMVQGKKSRRYVHGLVIVPTRELALQVSKVLKAVTKSANKLLKQTEKIVALPIYGGVSREEQIDSLCKNSQFIVAATPLRLIDLLGIGDKDGNGKQPVPNERIQRLFEPMRYLVIDEADQMATKSDMSQQVDLILNFLREKCTQLDRQCLFSATLPRRAVAKCNDWIELPRVTVKVDTVTVGEAMAKSGDSASGGKSAERAGALDLSTIPSHITQTLHVCSNHKKEKKLMITINKIRQEEKERGNGRGRGLLIIFFGRIKTLQRELLIS